MKLEFKDVSGGRKRQKFKLQNITFQIQEGYLTGLIGKNGAGKTTLFHTIIDKNAIYTGNILSDGVNIRENHTELMNRISYISDEPNYFMELTGKENGKLLQWLYREFSMEKFLKSMQMLNLSPYKLLKEMSRGEYIKFQMAISMSHQTELYLMDEVTAGMDVIYRKDFFRLLHELLVNERCSILMSTHIEEDIQKHMDYIIELEEGKITAYQEAGDYGTD